MEGETQDGKRGCPSVGTLSSPQQMYPAAQRRLARVAALGDPEGNPGEMGYSLAFSSSLRMFGFTLPGCGGSNSANPSLAAARLLSIWPEAR